MWVLIVPVTLLVYRPVSNLNRSKLSSIGYEWLISWLMPEICSWTTGVVRRLACPISLASMVHDLDMHVVLAKGRDIRVSEQPKWCLIDMYTSSTVYASYPLHEAIFNSWSQLISPHKYYYVLKVSITTLGPTKDTYEQQFPTKEGKRTKSDNWKNVQADSFQLYQTGNSSHSMWALLCVCVCMYRFACIRISLDSWPS